MSAVLEETPSGKNQQSQKWEQQIIKTNTTQNVKKHHLTAWCEMMKREGKGIVEHFSNILPEQNKNNRCYICTVIHNINTMSEEFSG